MSDHGQVIMITSKSYLNNVKTLNDFSKFIYPNVILELPVFKEIKYVLYIVYFLDSN